MTNRRFFIKNSSLLALGIPLLKTELFRAGIDLTLPAMGIQLYMVRDDMAKDPVGTLSKLGKMGYTQIESYNGDKGIFWGYTNKEFNRIAHDNGLKLVSSHYEGDSMGYEKTAALDNGMQYFFVEQSRLFHETAIQSAGINAEYLKKL